MKLEETAGAKQDIISHSLGDYSLLTRNQYACPAREVAAVDYRVRGRFLWLPMNKERLEDPLRSLMTHLRQCHLLHNLQLLQKLIHR